MLIVQVTTPASPRLFLQVVKSLVHYCHIYCRHDVSSELAAYLRGPPPQLRARPSPRPSPDRRHKTEVEHKLKPTLVDDVAAQHRGEERMLSPGQVASFRWIFGYLEPRCNL